jgi:hypothetical protein
MFPCEDKQLRGVLRTLQVKDFTHFSLALDESSDSCDTVQLLIFLQGITPDFGLLKRIQDQVAELNPDQKIIFLHCIIHQEVLCKCVLKMSHVVDTVTKVVNFIRAKSLNHRQFVSLLEETESGPADLPYHTDMSWLSLRKVLIKGCGT